MTSIPIQIVPGGTMPTKATHGAAAFDCYSRDEVTLSGWPVTVRLGFKIQLPENYAALILPRSGLALKQGIVIVNSPGLIDSDYRGEVAAIMATKGNDRIRIAYGDRVCQIAIVPMPTVEWYQVDALDDTERGEGGFGSTGG